MAEAIGLEQVLGQGFEVLIELGFGQVGRSVELLVDQGHGPDAILGVIEGAVEVGRGGEFARLHAEQAGDDLQIVFDPVVDFFEQDFLFAQRVVEILGAAFDPIFEFLVEGLEFAQVGLAFEFGGDSDGEDAEDFLGKFEVG